MYRVPPDRIAPHSLPPMGDRDFLSQEEETVNLRDYWIVLRKYRWTIVIFFLPIVLIAYLSNQGKAHVYTATATLYIENQAPNIIGAIGSSSTFTTGTSSLDYYKTQSILLRSRSLAAQVIRDLDLDHSPRFLRATDAPPSWVQRQVSWVQSQVAWVKRQVRRGLESMASWVQEGSQGSSEVVGEEEKKTDTFEFGVHPGLINRYLSKLSIIHLEETQMINVRFSSLDPSFSKEIANTHATTFIRTSLLTRFELTAEGRQFLEEKRAELKTKLERSEENLNRFRKAHAIVSLEKGENLVVERLRALNGDLTHARSKRIELESLYRIVQQRDNRFLSQIIDNPLVRQIKDQISALEMEKARLATTFKPTYSGVTAFQEQIDQAKNRMDEEIRRIIHSITSDYQAAIARERALADEMEAQRRTALDLREKAVEAAILEREVEADRALYENVLKRSKETDLTGTVPISNMRVVDRADVPLGPDGDRRNRTLLLSALVGLLGGVGLAFLRYYLDNTLKTQEDIGRFLRLPTLGMVPDIRRLDKGGYSLSYMQKILPRQRSLTSPEEEKTELVTSLHPLSLVRESYQTLCTALLFSLPERPPRTILVTSAEPLEGKTVTAMNIAATLARNGAPVLLIDADLRNGRCHRLLGIQNGSGLTNVLTGNGNATEFIKKTTHNNLYLLSRGEPAPNPTALLGSEKMRQLLESLQMEFPFIILDSAPLLPITDTVLLSTKVEGVLLVVKAQDVSRYAVRQACERLVYVKAKILGVVLNQIDLQSPEYKDYRSSYRSYYAAYS